MPKKRKSRHAQAKHSKIPKPVFASPFKVLKRMIRARAEAESTDANAKGRAGPTLTPQIEQSIQLDGAAILRDAFEGVRRFPNSRPGRVPLEPRVNRSVVSEDSEVMAELSDLVSGQGPFDITETDEYVEGSRKGIDPRLLTRLRRGEFAVQAHIDLHGMIQPVAQAALSAFIVDSARKGLRTALVVHGRGRRSPGGHAVLKRATVSWLSQSALAGYVLAFATARPSDGGAGAVYVLLKRERRRAPFDVLQGAKRRY